MNAYDIKAKFYGNAFSSDIYDLKTIRLLDNSLQNTFCQLLAIHLGQKELATELKSHIVQKVKIKNGVLQCFIQFEKEFSDKFGIYERDLSDNSSPMSLSDSVAKLCFSAMTLRRLLAESAKRGEKSTVIINTDPQKQMHSVIKTEQGKILLSHPKILWAAQMTQEYIDTIMDCVNKDLITHFDIEGLSKPMYFTQEALMMLGQTKDQLTATANFKGRLDHMLYSSKQGTVIAPHDIYQISWDEDMQVADYVNRDDVEFIAKPLISSNDSQKGLIIYKIVDCIVANQDCHSTEHERAC